jgi:hypothetical protein
VKPLPLAPFLPAAARSRTASASDSSSFPDRAKPIAASNADTDSMCCPSAAWHLHLPTPQHSALAPPAPSMIRCGCGSPEGRSARRPCRSNTSATSTRAVVGKAAEKTVQCIVVASAGGKSSSQLSSTSHVPTAKLSTARRERQPCARGTCE